MNSITIANLVEALDPTIDNEELRDRIRYFDNLSHQDTRAILITLISWSNSLMGGLASVAPGGVEEAMASMRLAAAGTMDIYDTYGIMEG